MTKLIVIGAGVGGLTAAALLAKAGYDVTVLEAHVYPGGCAGTFYHQGYRFDAGATLAGGFQPNGPHALVGELLGIQWPIRRAEPAWTVQLPDRRVVRWGYNEQWQAERDQQLPDLHYFWPQQEHIAEVVWRMAARIPPYPPASISDVTRLATKLRPELLPLAPLALTSVGRWLKLNRIQDRASWAFINAQLLISAQATAEQANALYGAVAIDLPRVGAHHVMGGIGNIAETLVAAFQALGGIYLKRQAVTSISPLGQQRYQVATNKGLVMEADAVLANLTPWGLQSLLGDHAPTRLQRETQQRGDTWGAYTLYLGVDTDSVNSDCDHYQVIRHYDQPLGEGNSVFISLSDPQDYSRAPQGQRTMTLSTHTNISTWYTLQQNDPDAYHARREQYQEQLLQAAESVLPNLRKGIRFIMNGTPQTFQKFTRRPRGMVGGFPQTSLLAARGPQTGLPHLWLVGDSVFPGQSTAGVTAGAMRVAAEVMRTLRP